MENKNHPERWLFLLPSYIIIRPRTALHSYFYCFCLYITIYYCRYIVCTFFSSISQSIRASCSSPFTIWTSSRLSIICFSTSMNNTRNTADLVCSLSLSRWGLLPHHILSCVWYITSFGMLFCDNNRCCNCLSKFLIYEE